MMDKKLHAAQTAAGKMFARMNSEIDPLKGKKPVDASYSSDPSSATPAPTSEQFYGMPPNSFVGQTPRPTSVYTISVGLILATSQIGLTVQTDQVPSQTGVMVMTPPSLTPLASIPG